jgi:hypothetical protein
MSKELIDYFDFSKAEPYWHKFEGDFLHDKRHGYGILYFQDGSKFTGRFHEGKVHGKGTFYLKNGDVVNSKWEKNIMLL